MKSPEQVISDFMETEGRFEAGKDGWLWCSDSNAGFSPTDLIKALSDAGYAIVKNEDVRR
jgi:hypothetical protein